MLSPERAHTRKRRDVFSLEKPLKRLKISGDKPKNAFDIDATSFNYSPRDSSKGGGIQSFHLTAIPEEDDDALYSGEIVYPDSIEIPDDDEDLEEETPIHRLKKGRAKFRVLLPNHLIKDIIPSVVLDDGGGGAPSSSNPSVLKEISKLPHLEPALNPYQIIPYVARDEFGATLPPSTSNKDVDVVDEDVDNSTLQTNESDIMMDGSEGGLETMGSLPSEMEEG